jgi:phosphoglycerate dehydrogenase-like enzyme
VSTASSLDGSARTPGDVLVTFPGYDADGPDDGGALRAAGLGLRLSPRHRERTPAELSRLVGDAVAAIVSTDPFDASVLDAAPRLRVIARLGVGVDSIDLAAATRNGIAVTVTPGANEETVADHTLALMLAVLRRVCELDGDVRSGAWNRTGSFTPWLLSGACVGLVGYGRIGRLVADRLNGFGVRLLVCDPVAPAEERVERVTLPELLATADVVSLHTPLLPSTRCLIDAAALDAMRPDAILVNTARGGVVDEDALVAALASGRLRGAALDVFSEEPPVSSALLALRNVVLSPHNAGLSVRSLA